MIKVNIEIKTDKVVKTIYFLGIKLITKILNVQQNSYNVGKGLESYLGLIKN